jgi:hypothetical protein
MHLSIFYGDDNYYCFHYCYDYNDDPKNSSCFIFLAIINITQVLLITLECVVIDHKSTITIIITSIVDYDQLLHTDINN